MTQPATQSPSTARPGQRRASPVQIPWREIACRLADGARPAAIAADLGLQEERIWRHLRQSLRFRFYLRQAMERRRLLAELQLAALGQAALVARGLDPDSLDGDLLRLLNEAAPEGDLGPQIETLGKTGERPPNMAFRRRLAEEKQRMDLQVEIWRAQDAARAAGAAAAAEAARSAANASEAVRSATNAHEAPRTLANTGEAARSAAKPSEVEPAPRPRPPSPPAEPPPPAVVDLDGPDLARLRAQGLLGGATAPGGMPDS